MADINDEKEQLKILEDLYGENKFSEAIALCEKLSEDFPDSFPIKLLHGKSLIKLERLDEAETVLIELIQSYSDNINLLQEVGDLYSKKENFDKALEYFDKILFLDPFNSQAKQSIDRVHTILKQTDTLKEVADEVPSEEVKDESTDEFKKEEIPSPVSTIENGEKKEEKVEKMIDDEVSLPPEPIEEKPIEIDIEIKKEETDEEVKEEVKLPEPMVELEKEKPEEKKKEAAEKPNGETEFITESAAELYLTQGLFDDALSIYEKLYDRNKEERFLERIKQIKGKRMGQKKAQKLSEFLEQIRKKGDKFV